MPNPNSQPVPAILQTPFETLLNMIRSSLPTDNPLFGTWQNLIVYISAKYTALKEINQSAANKIMRQEALARQAQEDINQLKFQIHEHISNHEVSISRIMELEQALQEEKAEHCRTKSRLYDTSKQLEAFVPGLNLAEINPNHTDGVSPIRTPEWPGILHFGAAAAAADGPENISKPKDNPSSKRRKLIQS